MPKVIILHVGYSDKKDRRIFCKACRDKTNGSLPEQEVAIQVLPTSQLSYGEE